MDGADIATLGEALVDGLHGQVEPVLELVVQRFG